jgi:hypothetical protein
MDTPQNELINQLVRLSGLALGMQIYLGERPQACVVTKNGAGINRRLILQQNSAYCGQGNAE